MAVEQTISVYRGEQVVLNFTMAPVVDITTWTLVFSLVKKANSTTKLITQSAPVISGPLGTFRVTLTEEQMNLSPAIYFFDVWRTDEGFEQVLAIGPFIVRATARVP